MSLLYVGCIKFPTNHFVGNFCPLKKKKKKKKPNVYLIDFLEHKPMSNSNSTLSVHKKNKVTFKIFNKRVIN
jgi:glycogen synthase